MVSGVAGARAAVAPVLARSFGGNGSVESITRLKAAGTACKHMEFSSSRRMFSAHQ